MLALHPAATVPGTSDRFGREMINKIRQWLSLPVYLLQMTAALMGVLLMYLGRLGFWLSSGNGRHVYWPLARARRFVAGEPSWKVVDLERLGIQPKTEADKQLAREAGYEPYTCSCPNPDCVGRTETWVKKFDPSMMPVPVRPDGRPLPFSYNGPDVANVAQDGVFLPPVTLLDKYRDAFERLRGGDLFVTIGVIFVTPARRLELGDAAADILPEDLEEARKSFDPNGWGPTNDRTIAVIAPLR